MIHLINKTRLALGALILGMFGLGVALVPVGQAHADAGSPGCVTRHEYGEVHKGMTKTTVDRIFGTHGKRDAGSTSGGYHAEVWSYHPCNRYSAISISFDGYGYPLHLSYKAAVWSY